MPSAVFDASARLVCMAGFAAVGVMLAVALIYRLARPRKDLHHAAAHGAVGVMTQLLDAGVPVDRTDDIGRTPLHNAVTACQRAADRKSVV